MNKAQLPKCCAAKSKQVRNNGMLRSAFKERNNMRAQIYTQPGVERANSSNSSGELAPPPTLLLWRLNDAPQLRQQIPIKQRVRNVLVDFRGVEPLINQFLVRWRESLPRQRQDLAAFFQGVDIVHAQQGEADVFARIVLPQMPRQRAAPGLRVCRKRKDASLTSFQRLSSLA